MKIETTKKITNLKGDAYQADGADLTLGIVCAEAVATYEIGGKMKSYVLAQRLYTSTEEIEFDAADISLIKAALEACKSYNSIILGQALLCLN